jgi:hypothetical protein
LKQATLVSGTNIKTINGTSVLGSGDIVVSNKKNFIYNLDHIQLANTASTYLGKSTTAVTYSINTGTADSTQVINAAWNKFVLSTPYKCIMKKVTWGTNGNLSIYVGGLKGGVKTTLFASDPTGQLDINTTDVTIEADTQIYLFFKTASTGQSVIQGTIYFEEF